MTYREYYSGKKVLVTGGAGAIGSRLTRQLVELNATVIVLDDLSSGYEWNLPGDAGNLLFVKGGIANDVDLKRVFNEEPRIIFHLAALFANQNSIDYPEKDLRTNGFGTLKLLEYSTLCDQPERFVYASSSSIYGNVTALPLKEDNISMHLSTPYQVTKMLGELYCNYFLKQYGLKVVKARFFNSYGPGEVPGQYRNVIPNFIYRAIKGLPLTITGTGEETRDFTYVGDVVDGLLKAGYLDGAVGEEFNFASCAETRIIELANMVNELTGNTAPIKFAERRKWDAKGRRLGSYDKAEKAIGYKPNMPFDQGLKNTVEWFREHWDDIENSAGFGPGMSSAVRGVSLK